MKNKSTVRLALACLVAMGFVILLSTCSGQADVLPREYIVNSGDTIWSIATEQCPYMRTDEAVYLIRKWNGNEDCLIYAGEMLLIPTVRGDESDVL